MGSWEDGALKTGWQKITVYDQDEDDDYGLLVQLQVQR